MNLKLQFDAKNIKCSSVVYIFDEVKMRFHSNEITEITFSNRHTCVFVFGGDLLMGFRKSISGGVYQAAICVFAVLSSHQGKGVGNPIMDHMIQNCIMCSFIFYASPGKEIFYEKKKFRKLKTGLAFFTNIEKMREKDFPGYQLLSITNVIQDLKMGSGLNNISTAFLVHCKRNK